MAKNENAISLDAGAIDDLLSKLMRLRENDGNLGTFELWLERETMQRYE